jgi:hypothetical protein
MTTSQLLTTPNAHFTIYTHAQNCNRAGMVAGIAENDDDANEKGIIVNDCDTIEGTRESIISEAENTIEYLSTKCLNANQMFQWRRANAILDYLT